MAIANANTAYLIGVPISKLSQEKIPLSVRVISISSREKKMSLTPRHYRDGEAPFIRCTPGEQNVL